MLLYRATTTLLATPCFGMRAARGTTAWMSTSASSDPVQTKRLLLGVLGYELEAQERKRTALMDQLSSSAASTEEDDEKAAAKALRRKQQVPVRLAEVDSAQERLRELMEIVRARNIDLDACTAAAVEMGLGPRLETFDVEAFSRSQSSYGRPDGFDGLVFESPRGIPILVARQSFKDSLLRRIGRGKDLFFQVQEQRGSRVLLRTSMRRDISRSPRECMEMAADLASYFSDWKYADDGDVEVMFTDARQVAKRGTRVGQMKRSKSLGTLWASPSRVADMAKEAQEIQGWL